MVPSEIIEKRILISVLNWGMGHVSRSIGLIHQLKTQNNAIFIACSAEQKVVFEQYFGDVIFIDHEGYPFNFGGKGNFALDLFKKVVSLKKRMKKEQIEVELMVNEHAIDIVLSDHRYGFNTPLAQSYFITHQFNLPVPWYQRNADRLHKKLMSKFDGVWIMDYSNSKLAGKLSQTKSSDRVHYIGPYTRFTLYEKNLVVPRHGMVLVASGPKIYAQQLVDEVCAANKESEISVICDEGIKVPKQFKKLTGNWREQDKEIVSAQKIISRSGYSTIMDIDFLKCEAEFIPTPGQAEQIYLANQ